MSKVERSYGKKESIIILKQSQNVEQYAKKNKNKKNPNNSNKKNLLRAHRVEVLKLIKYLHFLNCKYSHGSNSGLMKVEMVYK